MSPANQDLATSDAIRISREVDPTRERTLGVLTKIDLMDKGTDLLRNSGRPIYVHFVCRTLKYWKEVISAKMSLGWVVNRSQADINKNVDMIAARCREREYFSTTLEYKHLAPRTGSEHLAKMLSKVGNWIAFINLVSISIRGNQELKQYPALRVEVTNAARDSLERMREESKKATLKLVDMECSYLTVDFFRELPQDVEKRGNPSHSIFDRYNDSYLRRIGTTVLAYVNMVCASLRNSIPKSIVYCQVREAKRSFLDHFYTDLGKLETKQLSSLLNEDPAIMERRSALAKRLELYRSAQAEIDSVAWAK
ncbi:unnamed protein product [Prunus armeniaca]